MKRYLSILLIAAIFSNNIIVLEHVLFEDIEICTEQKIHIDESKEDCSICYFFNSRADNYILTAKGSFFISSFYELINFNFKIFSSISINFFDSRAPPVY